MNVTFEKGNAGRNKVLIMRGCDVDTVMDKQEIADFLTGKGTNTIVIEQATIPERALMMSYLPFIHSIFLENYNSPEWKKLEGNEIKISFHNVANAPIIIEVSDDLYNFLTSR